MPGRDALTPAEREARRRRLAEVFGEVLPEQTRDDGSFEDRAREEVRGGGDSDDDRLRRDVPPHHGPVG